MIGLTFWQAKYGHAAGYVYLRNKNTDMCGRFSLTLNEAELNARFELAGGTPMYVPRYNGAPSQPLGVITNLAPHRLSLYRWGLVPTWAKEPGIGSRMINARAETISEKGAFRVPFRRKRCIVPADGYFEWKQDSHKQPYRIVLKNRQAFGMAGLWEEWADAKGEILNTFCIITTEANRRLNHLHPRMPVILPPDKEKAWLESDDLVLLQGLLAPYSEDLTEFYPVGRLVNSVRNDSPQIIEPAIIESTPELF